MDIIFVFGTKGRGSNPLEGTMKSQKLGFLFLIIFLEILLFPLVSLAGEYKANNYTITYEGLVPCGKCVNITPVVTANKTDKERCGATEWQPTNIKYFPCQFCHFFVMFKAIIDFVLQLVMAIAVLMLVIGGVMFFTAMGNPEKLGTAKNLITSVVWGVVIIFGAWIVINTIFTFIGLSDFALQFTGPGKWFTINCPIKL